MSFRSGIQKQRAKTEFRASSEIDDRKVRKMIKNQIHVLAETMLDMLEVLEWKGDDQNGDGHQSEFRKRFNHIVEVTKGESRLHKDIDRCDNDGARQCQQRRIGFNGGCLIMGNVDIELLLNRLIGEWDELDRQAELADSFPNLLRELIESCEKNEKEPDPMSAEIKVMDYISEAWVLFCKLPTQHPDDQTDFRNAIHRLQELIAVRIARHYRPDVFAIKNEQGEA